MAYVDYYIIQFKNNLFEDITIRIQKKDGDVDHDVVYYKPAEVSIKCDEKGGEGIFAPVISRELEVSFYLEEGQEDYWDEFQNALHDTWKVIASIAGMDSSDSFFKFHGFAIPDEGPVPFQDKPYKATIRARDMLGLLDQIDLTRIDGSKFEGEYTWIEYIAAVLSKTSLELPIRIYDDVYHEGMLTRDDDFKWDCFSQSKFEYRTFLKDSVKFTDCLEVLKIILGRSHRLFYWNGQWVIFRLSLHQYVPFSLYYTLYDKNGENAVGAMDLDSYATVGKNEIIQAINKDQILSSTFARHSVQTGYDFIIWPELPKNNVFERGTLLSTEELTGPQRTVKKYTIDDWGYGSYSGFPSQDSSLPNLTPDSAIAYRQSTFNIYGVETDREIVLEEVNSGTRGLLLSDKIPVIAGDKIKISFDSKMSVSGTGTRQVAFIFILPDIGGSKYNVESQNTSQMTPFYWLQGGAGHFISKFYQTGENFNTYTQFSIEPPEIPVNGHLYIGFITPGTTGSKSYIKNFSVEYIPYVAGGYIQVKGDYWLRTQNKLFNDKSDVKVQISDNPHKVFKGCILDTNGLPTTTAWFRHGLTETRHYKELVNIAEYNLLYRRFRTLDGTWRGLTYVPANNVTQHLPISFHKTYRQVNFANENKQFVLLCPLEMDLITGRSRCVFQEVLSASTTYTEQTESFNQFRGRIVNAINQTTAEQWDSEGNAPSIQTGFPPVAYVYPDESWLIGEDRAIGVIINPDDDMTATGPGISVIFDDITFDGYRMIVFQFASEDINVGDEYVFTAYGHEVHITVQSIQVADHDDGKLLGDNSEFKYDFGKQN